MVLQPDLKQRLERKATFEAAVKELTAAVLQTGGTGGAADGDLATLVPRTHALLKARYSNPAYWKAGLELFTAVQASESTPAALKEKLPAYVKDALCFVAEGLDAADEGQEPQQQQQQTLGELLLGLPPPQPAHSHLSDAGLVLEPPQRPAAAAAAATDAAAGGQQGGGDAEPPGVLDILRRLAQQQHAADGSDEQQQQQQQQEAGQGTGGISAQAEQLQAELLLGGSSSRAELEALLISMVEQHTAGQGGGSGGSSRPAASKAAVAQLPVISIDGQQQLQVVGGPGTACAVCTEELQQGDRVQLLPCKHAFHVDCLAPWLQQDNSCPVCRKELPTDDHAYEARKERAAVEEEERQGAANAQSHHDFAYI